MDVDAAADLPVTVARAYASLADLGTYPAWLSIVQAAVPAAPMEGDAGPAWWVDLGARLGPIRRTKRVRMVRTDAAEPVRVRFERVEHDGRTHADWILTGSLAPRGEAACHLAMHLHYGGSRSLPIADLVLAGEIRRAGARLAAVLAAESERS